MRGGAVSSREISSKKFESFSCVNVDLLSSTSCEFQNASAFCLPEAIRLKEEIFRLKFQQTCPFRPFA